MKRGFLLAAALVLGPLFGSNAPAQSGNFRDAAVAINATIRANHYHRTELDDAGYRQIEQP